jgi:hypothetical protein
MTTDSDAIATIAAIRAGDLPGLQRLLSDDPGLAASRLKIAKGRTPLHVVSDWPGYFPDGPRVAKTLIDAGAVIDARSTGDEHGETPLHWTASSDARLRLSVNAFLTYPFGRPGYRFDDVVEEHGRSLDMRRCPVADFLGQRNAADLCAGSWCNLDYALAEMWGARLERTSTLVGGASCCDFRFLALGPSEVAEPPRPVPSASTASDVNLTPHRRSGGTRATSPDLSEMSTQ